MASDINRVNLIGRLTRDPDIKQIPSGTSIASFSIANKKTYVSNGEKKEECSFLNCICWGKGGEIISQYAKKGSRIAIEGRLQQRTWQDKDGNNRSVIEIVVDNFQFLDSKKQSSDNSGYDHSQPTYQAGGENPTVVDDSDIPF